MNDRKLILRVTADDCDWEYIRGSGAGGQKRNKTSNAVRVTHRASGASAFAQEQRSQLQNRHAAFRKMAESSIFKAWLRAEIARRSGEEDRLQEAVEIAMDDRNIRCEVKDDQGRWQVTSGPLEEAYEKPK
ncbi:MAG: peptide chain release factor-like protein [Betaproteobacteria bacterium]|nr:peptide chain release factor-like protein [Betaproteobacteria bacterium]